MNIPFRPPSLGVSCLAMKLVRTRRSSRNVLVRRVVVACAVAVAASIPRLASSQSGNEVLDQAPRVVETSTFRAEVLSLALHDPHLGTLTLRLANTGAESVTAALRYQVRVSGWSRIRNLRTDITRTFQLPAGAVLVDSTRLIIPGYSHDATLVLQFGPGEAPTDESGFGRLLRVEATRTYALGGTAEAREWVDRFALTEEAGVQVLVRRGTGLEDTLPHLAGERVRALAGISELLGVQPPSRVRVVFYPDPILKWVETGHFGTGWAFDSTLVEVLAGARSMDPFHELTHLMATRVGSPPAMFREGLAVYVAERLDARPLGFLGRSESIAAAVCSDLSRDALFPLADLIRFDGIGSPETRPAVSYAQSASFVGFLVDRLGMQRFLRAYSLLPAADGAEPIADVPSAFADAFGMSLHAAEAEWLAGVRRDCPGMRGKTLERSSTAAPVQN